MAILVTGAAGFIGYHLCQALLARGDRVIGLDNVNAYYDPKLKEARLARLARHSGFMLLRLDITDRAAIQGLVTQYPEIHRIAHLAAQAGVRHSLTHPRDYVQANLVGFLEMLELARGLPKCQHLVYASSSSIYGGNTKQPFSIEDRTDKPLALYGATKRANELMAYSYSHLYQLPTTGLRFFTVYGPWGRPDMSAYIFTRQIMADEEITVNNRGEVLRDFTYVDDIVAGVVAALDRAPVAKENEPPHRIYNLGNHRTESLMRFINLIETALGKKAKIKLAGLPPGDVKETFADIEASTRDLGFQPRVTIDEGIPRFVAWYRDYNKL